LLIATVRLKCSLLLLMTGPMAQRHRRQKARLGEMSRHSMFGRICIVRQVSI